MLRSVGDDRPHPALANWLMHSAVMERRTEQRSPLYEKPI